MVEIIVGENVKSVNGEIGKILSFNDVYIEVEYENRVEELRRDAFEERVIAYESPELRARADSSIAAQMGEGKDSMTPAERQEWQNRRHAISKAVYPDERIRFERVRLRIDDAPVNLSSAREEDVAIIKEVFDLCDRDTPRVFDLFTPTVDYTRYTADSRSKYYGGFVCSYGGVHVVRVFARNDRYSRGPVCGTVVMDSDTTEIGRNFCIGDKTYYFCKNMYGFNTTEANEAWHETYLALSVTLDEVKRCGECGYLNDYIADKEVSCSEYIRLLFPALSDPKAEIVFKHKRYKSCYRIDNLSKYLSEFTMKQVDFAAKNDVINALPIIKSCGVYDVNILRGIEEMTIARDFYFGGYNTLVRWYEELGLDKSDLDQRLVSFIRRVERFDANIYRDYLILLSTRRIVTARDLFAGDYVEQHDIMQQRRATRSTREDEESYAIIAGELSWIDREDNGYYVIVPKSIDDFKYEGEIQHNCVYTGRYYSFVISRESIVVFLRRERDVPFVTVEFDYRSFALLQAYGRHNTEVDGELREYIVSLGKRLLHERSHGDG